MSNSLLEKLKESFVLTKEMQNPAEYTVASISFLSPGFLSALSENKVLDYITQVLFGVSNVNKKVYDIRLHGVFDITLKAQLDLTQNQDIIEYASYCQNILFVNLDSVMRLLVAERNLERIDEFYSIENTVITTSNFKTDVKSQIEFLKNIVNKLFSWDQLVATLMNPNESFSESEEKIIATVKFVD